jgi:transposase
MRAFTTGREQLEHEVVTRFAQGEFVRTIARHVGIGRNTVRRILRRHQAQRDQGHDLLGGSKPVLPRASKLDPFVPQIQELLKKYPDITGQRILEEMRDSGYDGGRSIVSERLLKLRPHPKREPHIRFETDPGLQGQMDWSPYTLKFSRTGNTKVLCFSYILGFSRRQYVDFTLHRDHFTLIRRHQDAFAHFGGVPRHCLYDGEKTVLLRWETGQPIFNPAFVAFITHYHCRPVMCRPKSPETKGKVEAPFKYVENNLLGGRTFQDLEDLRSTARWWLQHRSDTHDHDTTRRPPLELFLEQEQNALQPLPAHPYDSSEVALRICRLDGFLEFETNSYSVAYEHVTDILTLKATECQISIYSPELALVAEHERMPAGARRVSENPAHRTAKKVRYGLEPVKESFLALGESAAAFLEGLKALQPRFCGFHARCILRLKEHFLSEDIHRALAHAMRYQAFDAKAIERILKAKFPRRTLESIRNERASKALEQALPKIRQRPLEEYQTCFTPEEDDDGSATSES